MSDPLSIPDIAARLGISRGVVDQCRHRGEFPAPLNDVGHPRWSVEVVDAWARETGRLPLAIIQAEVLLESSDPVVDAPRENQVLSAPRETSDVEHAPIERPALAGLCRSLVALGDPAVYVGEHGVKAAGDAQKALGWLRGYLKATSGGPVLDCEHPKDKIKRLTWGTVCEACSTRIS